MSNPTLVVGIKPWKRWQITPFLAPRYGALRYVSAAAARRAQAGQRVVVWAARETADFAQTLAQRGATLVRMEDGFLRSVGLGSNHVGGYSLVLDEVGIYFDPRQPSALEQLLEHEAMAPDLLVRAAALRAQLVQSGLTKYNVGGRAAVTLPATPGRPRLLVPGQVENDASLRLGSPLLRDNLALLQAVRTAHPQAFIVYKPHPDTEAGTRPGQVPDRTVLAHADHVVRGVAATALFPQVDAVHTLTSLLGFEALLRGLPVTCWGQPFYAGWGLTEDHLPIARRTRRLTLDALVAGTLIRYPLYRHPHKGAPCAVEDVATALVAAGTTTAARQRSPLRRWGRQGLGLLRALRP